MAFPGKILSKGLNARMPELLFHPDIAIEIKASLVGMKLKGWVMIS